MRIYRKVRLGSNGSVRSLLTGTLTPVKGFGRRPWRGRGRRLEGRRPKASKGGNRGSERRWRTRRPPMGIWRSLGRRRAVLAAYVRTGREGGRMHRFRPLAGAAGVQQKNENPLPATRRRYRPSSAGPSRHRRPSLEEPTRPRERRGHARLVLTIARTTRSTSDEGDCVGDPPVEIASFGRTGACAQAGDLPTGPYQTRVHTEGQRQTQAAGHLNLAGKRRAHATPSYARDRKKLSKLGEDVTETLEVVPGCDDHP